MMEKHFLPQYQMHHKLVINAKEKNKKGIGLLGSSILVVLLRNTIVAKAFVNE